MVLTGEDPSPGESKSNPTNLDAEELLRTKNIEVGSRDVRDILQISDSTLKRWRQFLVYIPIFALFFLLNNSKIFAQMRVKEARMKGAKAFFVSWYHNALCMVGGILIVILIEYIPFFLGIGPGADLLFHLLLQ